MPITCLSFLLFALAAVMLYYLFPKRLRQYVLLAASILFYLTYGVRMAGYLAATILLTYLFGLWLDRLAAFRPAAEKQARITVTLNKIVEAENITVSDEEVEAEYADLAKQYELELDKVKSMVPAEEITDSLKSKKAIRIIVDSAKAVAPAAKEETKTEE